MPIHACIKEFHGSQEVFCQILERIQDAAYLADDQGRILYANPAAGKVFGYERESLLGKKVMEFEPDMTPAKWQAFFLRLQELKEITVNSRYLRPDGVETPVEINSNYLNLEGVEFCIAIARDVSRDYLQSELRLLQSHLSDMVHDRDEANLLQYGLDQAEKLTQSEIAFLYFVQSDEQDEALQVCSSRTKELMDGDFPYYLSEQVGMWVQSYITHEPVLCNDFSQYPNRKGLPEWHTGIRRFLTVPLVQKDAVVAVIGMANKVSDYNQSDIDLLYCITEMIDAYRRRQKSEQRVGFDYYHDGLTGVANRQLMMDRVEQSIADATRHGQSFAVCYMDITGFRRVNNLYGHDFGDSVLQALAKRLQDALRMDDSIARLGGDEFAFILHQVDSSFHCEQALRRLLQSIIMPFDVMGERIHLTANIGATLYPMDTSDASTLLHHAYQSMYQAKSQEYLNFYIYNPQEPALVKGRQALIQEFPFALREGQFCLFLQPKVDLQNLQVIGFEGLIRWRHPEKGLLTPDKFLPELNGTVEEIVLGEWVVERALKKLQIWHREGLKLSLSINISPRQIQQSTFSDFVLSTLKKYPKELAQWLEIELLEDSDFDDSDAVLENMRILKEQGIRFLLDDFGTGYASLAHFYNLPFDLLKIDQNFVKRMLDRSDNLDIVEGVLRLSEAIQRPVVTEGVESIEIGYMLMKLGSQFAQGYGIARPMPMDRVTSWLEEWEHANPWQDLRAEIEDDHLRYDLGVAVFSQRWWVNAIERHLKICCMGEKVPATYHSGMPELDESKCQFYCWYRGIGKTRYGKMPGYGSLYEQHHEMHELAKQIYKCTEIGDYEQAWSLFAQLKKVSLKIIEQIEGFDA